MGSGREEGEVTLQCTEQQVCKESGIEQKAISQVRVTMDDLGGEIQLEEEEKVQEQEEKARLITQVLELQSTLEELSSRVDGVKEENLRLRSENQVLGQYIENLMTASKVFQGTEERPSK